MKKNIWLRLGITMQLITALAHSMSFVVSSSPANETEKQMRDLIINYRIDAGAGFYPSFHNLFNAVSVCFTLLCLGAALINIFLLRSKAAVQTTKGIQAIFALLFGIAFIVNLFLSFLPPIICLGLIFLFEVIAWRTVKVANP